jgi:hypothetical protein
MQLTWPNLGTLTNQTHLIPKILKFFWYHLVPLFGTLCYILLEYTHMSDVTPNILPLVVS